MAAITSGRDTTSFTDAGAPYEYSYPVAASTQLYPGGLAALNSSGYLVMASDATQDATVVGIVVDPTYLDTADNTGANGAINANVRQGVQDLASGTGADAITLANVGQDCFVIDDQTVGLTQGAVVGSRNRAGKIVGIDPATGQVQVLLGFVAGGPKAGQDIVMIATAALAQGIGVIPDTGTAGNVVAAGLGVPILGFVQNAPAAGGAAIVRYSGVGLVLTNGNQAIGDNLEVNASGKTKALVLLTTTTGSNPQPCIGGAIVGICLQAATGSQVVVALIEAAGGSLATTAA